MQLAQSYLQGQAGPFDGVLEAYGQGQVLRQNKDLLQAQQAEQARKIAAQQALETIDWNDKSAIARTVAQFPEYTKGAKEYYDALEQKEQQAMLYDMSTSISALSSDRPDIAVQNMRDKANAYRDAGNEEKAEEYSQMAAWMAREPKAAQRALLMHYAVLSPDKSGANYENYIKANVAEDAAPVDRAATQAKTMVERVNAAGGVNKLISTAALTDDPNTFMEMIDTAYDSGLIAPEKYNSLLESVSGDGEEAVATLRRLARGNPDIIDKLLPDVKYIDVGDGITVNSFDPQTGGVKTIGTMTKGINPETIYTETAETGRAQLAAETSRFNAEQQRMLQKYNIDLQDKQADKRLALAYAIEDNKKGVSKLENHGGKMYFVYPDGTAVEAKDIDNKPIKPTVNNDPTTKKAVAEQQSLIDNGQELLRVLRKAKAISDKGLYYGATANARAGAAQVLGGSDKSDRTLEYDTLITNSALQSMKSIFGANPTEGERELLLKVQASSKYPRHVREKILNEAIAAAENRINSSLSQMKILQGGSPRKTPTGADYSSVIEPIKKKK